MVTRPREPLADAIQRDLGILRRLYLHYKDLDHKAARALGHAVKWLEERVTELRSEHDPTR